MPELQGENSIEGKFFESPESSFALPESTFVPLVKESSYTHATPNTFCKDVFGMLLIRAIIFLSQDQH